MKNCVARYAICVMLILIGASKAGAAEITVTWTGTGGNDLWSNANNWQQLVVPCNAGAVEVNVIIPAGAGTIIHDIAGSCTIKSLTLGNSTLTIPLGSDLIVLDLTSIDGLINSTGGTFTACGPGTVFPGNLARVWVSNGGMVTICAPSLDTSGRNTSVTILSATGAGSLLDLSSLTSLTTAFNSGCCAPIRVHTITASGGGLIDLSGLQTTFPPARAEDYLSFVLPDAISMIDLSSLTTISGSGGRSRFILSNAATLTMPSLETMGDVHFTLSGGSLLTGGGVLPVSYSSSGMNWTTTLFDVSDPGTLLDLSSVTSLTTAFNSGCCAPIQVHTIATCDGGVIDLSGLQTLTMPARGEDRLDMTLSGPMPSLIDLSSLSLMNGGGTTRWNLSGGSELLTGDLTLRNCLKTRQIADTPSGHG